MEITLARKSRTDKSTIGILVYGDKSTCYTLEDPDRGLTQDMPIDKINHIKVLGNTAIPSGRYRVVISFSTRFKKYLPELLYVPGFSGIRIHPGNGPEDTSGCILVGSLIVGPDMVGGSKRAFSRLFTELKEVDPKQKNWITIK